MNDDPLRAYELLAELGRGGTGVVYQARCRATGDLVAVKMLTAGAAANPTQAERLAREARALGRVRHPGVIRLRASGWSRGRRFLVLDYHSGGTLAERIARGTLPPEETRALGVALASALDAVHAEGVLHRDLKPENVLYSSADQPLLTDFGLVKARAAGERSLTQTGLFLGTPGFLAPEQAVGGDSSASTDVYGLGATLYATLAGQAPFVEATLIESLRATVDRPPPPLRKARPDCPAGLARVIEACLAKDPRERPQSAADLAARLAAASPARSRLGPALAAAAGVALALALALAGAAAAAGPADAPQPAPATPSPPLASGAPTATPGAPGPAAASPSPTTSSLTERARQALQRREAREARRILEAARGSEDFAALHLLGVLLTQGPEEVRDFSRGLEAFREAAEGGHVASMSDYGIWLTKGPPEHRRRALGVEWLRRAAATGHVHGLANLGALLVESEDPAQVHEGRGYLVAAADRGDAPSARRLGELALEGRASEPDVDEAGEWFKKAAEGGDSLGMVRFGQHLEQRGGDALGWFRAAARDGEVEGMFHLARALIAEGETEALRSEGVTWLERAARRGHVASMNNLGLLLLGQGGGLVEADPALARSWLKTAADAGHPGATLSYGSVLARGVGGPRDLGGARRYLQAAARAADPRVVEAARRLLRLVERAEAGR